MNLRFTGNTSIRTMNEFLNAMNIQEKPVLPHDVTLNMSQIVPFIPDTNTIKEYEKAIEKSYNANNNNVVISEVHFDGYEYLYAIEQTMVSDERYETLRQKVISMGYEELSRYLEYFVPCNIDDEDRDARMLRKFQSMNPEQYSKCLRRYGIKKENET